MLARVLLPFALFAVFTQAIQITKPTKNEGWESTGSQLIEWTSVNTDKDSFSIYITQPGSDAKQVVAKNVKTADKSYIYTPTKDLAVQEGYRISFEADDGQAGILAQSDQFAVEKGVSTIKPTTTESLTTTGSTASPSGSATITGSQTSSASTESATSTGDSSAGQALAIPSTLLLLVTGLMGFFA